MRSCRAERVAAGLCPHCGLEPSLGYKFCDEYRAYYRERQAKIRRLRSGRSQAGESPLWNELEHAERCPRCSLRGPHECLPSVYELASSRRGGPTYPEAA